MVKVALAQTEGNGPVEKPSAPKRTRKPRWGVRLVLALAILLLAAPSAVTFLGQGAAALRIIHPKLGAAVRFREVQFHWWSPIRIRDFQLKDCSQFVTKDASDHPTPLITADTITTAEPLWKIALNAGRGTRLTIASPHLRMILGDGTSNLQETLESFFGRDQNSGPTFPVHVTISGGEVSYLTATGTQPPEQTGEEAQERAAFELTPIAEATRIEGVVSTLNTARWLPEVNLTASIQRPRNSLTSASDNRTRLAAGLDDIMSDFPAVPLDQLAGPEQDDSGTTQVRMILNPDADNKGRQVIQFGARDLDLRLLQPLLTMSGIPFEAEGILSGGIDSRIAGSSLQDGLVARVLLSGENIVLRHADWADGEKLPLGQVEASGAIALADDGLLVEELKLSSSLMELNGAGEIRTRSGKMSPAGQKVEVNGRVHLAAFVSTLKNTLGVRPEMQLEDGDLVFSLQASQGPEVSAEVRGKPRQPSVRTVAASGSAGRWQLTSSLENLRALRNGVPLRMDPELKLEAVGPIAAAAPELSQARISGNFGIIDLVPDGIAWKLTGRVSPESVVRQLREFVDMPDTGLRGEVAVQARVSLQSDAIQLTDAQIVSEDLRATSLSLRIFPEKALPAMLDGTLEIDGSGPAVRSLMAPFHDATWLADHSHVQAAFEAAPDKEISLRILITPGSVASSSHSSVRSVSSTRSPAPVTIGAMLSPSALTVDDAELRIVLNAEDSGRSFRVTDGMLKMPGLASTMTGLIAIPQNQMELDLTADTTYDLDQLSRRLFPAESGVQFSGQGHDTFRITGRPSANGSNDPQNNSSPMQLQGSGRVAWQSAVLWGLQAGPGAAELTLDQMLLRSSPVRCSLNEGEVVLMPQYDLAADTLELGTGSRIQNVRLSPEVCRTWLGYVAPLMADSVQVDGTVSARLEKFHWDFSEPRNSQVASQLTIHQAQASPGSSLVSLLEVVDLLRRKSQNSTAYSDRSLILPEQTVPVEVRQGAVLHDGLTMELSGYRMRSSGAVSLDDQLQLVLQIPLEKSDNGTARSVKVPLRGSISHPQLDTGNLLQNLGTQQLQEKIGNQVDKQLNQQLNKLLDRF